MSANNLKTTIRKRAPQARTEITKGRIIRVAIILFSECGYDAVSLRGIEIEAGVQRNLLKYHFGSKEELWKAAVELLISRAMAASSVRSDVIKDLTPHERVAFIIRNFVRSSAAHPELFRIMSQEATKYSWRTSWLVDNHLRKAMEALRAVVKMDLNLTDEEFVNWYYMFLASCAFVFAMRPEVDTLFSVDTQNHEFIERHIGMMVSYLLDRTGH